MFDNFVTKGENKFYSQFLLLSQGFLLKKKKAMPQDRKG